MSTTKNSKYKKNSPARTQDSQRKRPWARWQPPVSGERAHLLVKLAEYIKKEAERRKGEGRHRPTPRGQRTLAQVAESIATDPRFRELGPRTESWCRNLRRALATFGARRLEQLLVRFGLAKTLLLGQLPKAGAREFIRTNVVRLRNGKDGTIDEASYVAIKAVVRKPGSAKATRSVFNFPEDLLSVSDVLTAKLKLLYIRNDGVRLRPVDGVLVGLDKKKIKFLKKLLAVFDRLVDLALEKTPARTAVARRSYTKGTGEANKLSLRDRELWRLLRHLR